MQKKIYLLCTCLLLLGFCVFPGTLETELAFPEGQTVEHVGKWKEAYQNLLLEEDVKRMALLYLDEDDIPELLTLQDGEYRLYTFDGSQVTAIAMPDAGIRASAYARRHEVETAYPKGVLSFVWFEYVPRRGLIRVHDSDGFDGLRWGGARERCDYYLKYENGTLKLELETKFVDHTWQTCGEGQEIANEEFLRRLSDLGYDQLTPCGYLYENVEEAYKNRDRVSDSKKALDDFAAGKTEALYNVWKGTDIPEEGFLMKSFANAYSDFMIVNGDGHWQYVDFDNDGEEELVLRSDAGAYLFFDVIGGIVYRVMGISEYTAGVTYVAELEGNRVIANLDQSTDQVRGTDGYKYYTISQYDSCGCLVDYFQSAVSYEGVDYAAKDEFTYRNQPVALEKFEEIEGSMRQISPEGGKENQEKIELGRIKTAISPNEMYNIIALDDNGHVWKWKDWKTKEDAVLIPELENVVKILDTGYGSAYALTEEGDVYAWGRNRGWLIDPRVRDTNIVFPKPVKLKDLSDIAKIDAANGRALAVDREGRLFVWGLGRYKYSRTDYFPSLLEGYEERIDNVEEIYVGAGDFHYLKRKDNQIFSFLLAEHLGDDLDYFVVPNFAGEPAVPNWYQELCSGESERIFDVRVEEGPEIVYLYEMGKKDDIALISADSYTMYLYQTDGTLWYWNSDLITYHDDGRKGAALESWILDYRGFFEKVDVGEILDREPGDPAIPKIVSICPGAEGALFLLENDEVFVSGYVTTQIRDVEYIARYYSHPERNGPDVVHDFPLKGLDFRKLNYENIISISSDKKNKFYLVDKTGNIYCYQMDQSFTE